MTEELKYMTLRIDNIKKKEVMEAHPQLEDLPAFVELKKMSKDYNDLMKWILVCYDPNIRNYLPRSLARRREVSAQKAGVPWATIKPEIDNDIVVECIMQYCLLCHPNLWSNYLAMEHAIHAYNVNLMQNGGDSSLSNSLKDLASARDQFKAVEGLLDEMFNKEKRVKDTARLRMVKEITNPITLMAVEAVDSDQSYL